MATTEQIKPGEYADVMPEMSDEEFEALKRSIKEDGLKHPIEVTEDGVIVDGHHRYRACRELGIEPETTVVDEATVEEAIRANFTRRNLSEGAKKGVVVGYLEKHYDGDRTQEEVAEALGVSQPTVSRAMSEYSPNKFTREEKRQQVADYLDRNPDASNREVAEAVEADVSHVSVGNWREEWEAPDEEPAQESDTPDETSTEDTEPGEVVDEYSPDIESESGDVSEHVDAPEEPPEEEGPSDASSEEPERDDPTDAEETADDDAMSRVEELKEENERLQNKILEAAEIRTSVSKAKSAVDAARRHLQGKNPSIEAADGELEHAQTILEEVQG